jgi:hypothetical protein
MSATPAKSVPAGDSVVSGQAVSPYFAAKGNGTAATPPEPTATGVSSYHATSATPATRVPAGMSGPSNSPYNGSPAAPLKGQSLPMPTAKSVPATLPSPSAMPAVPMRTRPVPPPAAPVVPATLPGMTETPPVANEAVSHLLATAKGSGPVEVRKASIQELVKLKANTPEVLAAMDRLSDDPVPQIRAEAVIAGARLKMGR